MAIMSGDTPTQDLDRLAAFFGDGVAWSMPDDDRWFGEDFTGSEVVDRLRAEVGRLTGRAEWAERERDQAVQESDHMSTEVGRLTPDTPGEVSDHVRARFAEASAATLAGEGSCIGAGCIPAHQACEVLDAYDDARAALGRQEADADQQRELVGIAAAEVDRLTEMHGRATEHGVELSEQVETHESTIKKLRRDLCQAWGRDDCGQRFPSQAALDRAARAVAKRQGWDCYPEDSTMDEPDEMTVWRSYAAHNFITVDEHEENRRIEALDDAKASALFGTDEPGGDQ